MKNQWESLRTLWPASHALLGVNTGAHHWRKDELEARAATSRSLRLLLLIHKASAHHWRKDELEAARATASRST
eukprot:9821327-Lingulodinium_polyedra.AAC.1